jgi:hypothetical protein
LRHVENDAVVSGQYSVVKTAAAAAGAAMVVVAMFFVIGDV